MASYSEEVLVQKLSRLVDTQDSITVLSQWIIYHKKHAHTSVQTWAKELQKAAPHRKLSFLYLANDVVQCSRRKGDEFVKEFAKVFPSSLPHAYKHAPKEVQPKILRILSILEERNIFASEFTHAIRTKIENGDEGNTLPLAPHAVTSNEGRYLNSLMDTVARHEVSRVSLAEKANAIPPRLLKKEEILAGVSDRGVLLTEMDSAKAQLEQYHAALKQDAADRGKLIAELKKLMEKEELALQGTEIDILECGNKLKTLASIRHDIEHPQPQNTFSSPSTTPPQELQQSPQLQQQQQQPQQQQQQQQHQPESQPQQQPTTPPEPTQTTSTASSTPTLLTDFANLPAMMTPQLLAALSALGGMNSNTGTPPPNLIQTPASELTTADGIETLSMGLPMEMEPFTPTQDGVEEDDGYDPDGYDPGEHMGFLRGGLGGDGVGAEGDGVGGGWEGFGHVPIAGDGGGGGV
ncbi:Regulation of nuclear pre-mRNA domain containing protein 1B [Rhizophlyctis rosea]|nr:Regulation of nuclear pre-mRNA domain containing protein 1B [Rhizophlyctis rosea]